MNCRITESQSQKYKNTNDRNTEEEKDYRSAEIQIEPKLTHNSKVIHDLKVTHLSFIKYELWVNLKYG